MVWGLSFSCDQCRDYNCWVQVHTFPLLTVLFPLVHGHTAGLHFPDVLACITTWLHLGQWHMNKNGCVTSRSDWQKPWVHLSFEFFAMVVGLSTPSLLVYKIVVGKLIHIYIVTFAAHDPAKPILSPCPFHSSWSPVFTVTLLETKRALGCRASAFEDESLSPHSQHHQLPSVRGDWSSFSSLLLSSVCFYKHSLSRLWKHCCEIRPWKLQCRARD